MRRGSSRRSSSATASPRSGSAARPTACRWSAPVSAARLRDELARVRQGVDRLRQHVDEPLLRELLSRVHGSSRRRGSRCRSRSDGGATWGAPVTATAAFGADAEGALPLIQPDGALTIVFQAGAGMYAVRSTDGGATFALADGDRAALARRHSRCCALRRCRPRRSTRRAACSSRGRTARSGPGATATRSCSRRRRTARRGARSRACPGTGFDSFVPGIAADPSVPGRISIVTYVRNSSVVQRGDVLRSASRWSARATEARRGRSRDGSTRSRRATRGSPTRAAQFVGDYVGATYAGGRFVPVFALASRPLASGTLREYMMAASMP